MLTVMSQVIEKRVARIRFIFMAKRAIVGPEIA